MLATHCFIDEKFRECLDNAASHMCTAAKSMKGIPVFALIFDEANNPMATSSSDSIRIQYLDYHKGWLPTRKVDKRAKSLVGAAFQLHQAAMHKWYQGPKGYELMFCGDPARPKSAVHLLKHGESEDGSALESSSDVGSGDECENEREHGVCEECLCEWDADSEESSSSSFDAMKEHTHTGTELRLLIQPWRYPCDVAGVLDSKLVTFKSSSGVFTNQDILQHYTDYMDECLGWSELAAIVKGLGKEGSLGEDWLGEALAELKRVPAMKRKGNNSKSKLTRQWLATGDADTRRLLVGFDRRDITGQPTFYEEEFDT
jgi:hypothetical protein